MTDPEVQCHVRHIRQAAICMGGARDWFKLRDWDWSDFLSNGRPASDFVATGDPFAQRVVRAAVAEGRDNG